MKNFITLLSQEIRALIRDEKGLSATEYAVAGGLVAAAAAGAFTTLGSSISTRINTIATTISG